MDEDTTRRDFNTDFADVCFMSKFCMPSGKYRTINGECNNLMFSNWGKNGNAFTRVRPPRYSDGKFLFLNWRCLKRDEQFNKICIAGKHKPAKTKDGKSYEYARVIRVDALQESEKEDKAYTLLMMSWGQIIAHDTALSTSQQGGFSNMVN